MKIRSVAGSGETGAAENTFIAVDELENRLGQCRIESFRRGEAMPERPYEIRIEVDGEDGAISALLGTALTRAMISAQESGLNTRVYAECEPDNKRMMELYASVGLIDDDALIRMSRHVVEGGSVAPLPEGCVPVSDDLSDPQERAFFLDRQKRLFGRTDAEAWLDGLVRSRSMLKRLLLVTRDGLAGEALCWAEGGEGVVGMLYVAPAWRRKGVGFYLMEAARQYFYRCRLPESHVDVRLKQTAMVRVAATAGYRQSKTLTRLPGMNLDAPKRRGRA